MGSGVAPSLWPPGRPSMENWAWDKGLRDLAPSGVPGAPLGPPSGVRWGVRPGVRRGIPMGGTAKSVFSSVAGSCGRARSLRGFRARVRCRRFGGLPLRAAASGAGLFRDGCPGAGGVDERVKPFERLVPVGFTHCCASTPGLSTWWSSTALGRDLVLRGASRLDAFSGYPVRT